MRRRGFSLLEVTVSLSLSGLVIGGAVALYTFSMRRAAQDAQVARIQTQTQQLSLLIGRDVRQAISCDVITLPSTIGVMSDGTALRCAMPENFVTTDSDALGDTYMPTKVTARGEEVPVPGSWVWYCVKALTGSDSTKRIQRAVTASPDPTALPTTLGGFDQTFARTPEGRDRWDLVGTLSMSCNSQSNSCSFSAWVNSGVGPTRAAWNVAENQDQAVTLQTDAYWNNTIPGSVRGTGPQLLTNGYFEAGALTGWTTANLTGTSLSTTTSFANSLVSGLILNQSNVVGQTSISQNVATITGRSYVVSFSYGSHNPSGASVGQIQQLQVTATRTDTSAMLFQQTVVDPSLVASNSALFWLMRDYSFSFKAASAQTRIEFRDVTTLAGSSSCDGLLGRIEVREL